MEMPTQDPGEMNALEDAPAPADVAGGGSDDLSSPDTTSDSTTTPSKGPKDTPPPAGKKKKSGNKRLQALVSGINIYLLIFILIMLLAGLGVFVSIQRSKDATDEPTLTTQDLTQEALE